MREKQLVTSKMAPKEATSKGKEKEVASVEATLEDGERTYRSKTWAREWSANNCAREMAY